MKDLKKLEKEYIKKIRKGASLCVRKKFLFLFESEELIFTAKFSLNKYRKIEKYETFQLEVSIAGKGYIISSLQSEAGKHNLKVLYSLIQEYKQIKSAIKTLERVKEFEKNLTKYRFRKKTRRENSHS